MLTCADPAALPDTDLADLFIVSQIEVKQGETAVWQSMLVWNETVDGSDPYAVRSAMSADEVSLQTSSARMVSDVSSGSTTEIASSPITL